jgi:integrase
MLKWGILRKLVPHQVYVEAKFVPGLKKGKTKARENLPVQDVSDEVVNRSLPHFLPTLRDMVQVQRWGSMRPSEVCRMKAGEIDTNYKTDDGTMIWMYTPGTHKNAWRKKSRKGEYVRIIPLGRPEQEILATRLIGKSDDDHVFSPREAMKEHYAIRAANRKTKIQPSQVKRKERTAKNPKRKDRDHYDKGSYYHAITKMIKNANKLLPEGEKIPHWFPYQLRHAGITDIVEQTGSLDTARAVAGQKSISVTQGYNHADVKIAVEQAVKRSH